MCALVMLVVLGTRFKPSARVAHTFKHGVISLAFSFAVLKIVPWNHVIYAACALDYSLPLGVGGEVMQNQGTDSRSR